MAKTDVWMPIYPGDYLRDTQELTAEEHGAYFLLLLHYWQKRGDIGTDINRLSVVARASKETTLFILNRFFTLNADSYKNKRSDKELLNASSRSEAARSNVMKRWGKEKDTPVLPPYYDGNTTVYTEPIRNGYSSPSPSPSQSDKEHKTSAKPKKNKYGTFNNVLLSIVEYDKLVSELGVNETDSWIKKVDEGIELKGYKYKSHYLAIKHWREKEGATKKQTVNNKWGDRPLLVDVFCTVHPEERLRGGICYVCEESRNG